MSKAVLVDLVRCMGCRACQVACKAWNDNPGEVTLCLGCYDNPPDLSADTWSIMRFNELERNGQLHWVFTKRQCMHCEDPGCVSACIVGAFQKLDNGAVVYDDKKCIGCRYCMMACPFRVPKFEWDTPVPLIRKCTFCADRQGAGLEPACVKACPTGALTYGDRNDMIAEGHRRIEARPGKYVNHIYGEREVGGTSWMYLSPVPFEELGFPSVSDRPVTIGSETAMIATPGVIVGAAAVLSGIYWVTKRRMEAESAASTGAQEKED
jgi:formate dehydrogenase iron-sulfur subunit